MTTCNCRPKKNRLLIELSLAEARMLSLAAAQTIDYDDVLKSTFPTYSQRWAARRALNLLDTAIRTRLERS